MISKFSLMSKNAFQFLKLLTAIVQAANKTTEMFIISKQGQV